MKSFLPCLLFTILGCAAVKGSSRPEKTETQKESSLSHKDQPNMENIKDALNLIGVKNRDAILQALLSNNTNSNTEEGGIKPVPAQASAPAQTQLSTGIQKKEDLHSEADYAKSVEAESLRFYSKMFSVLFQDKVGVDVVINQKIDFKEFLSGNETGDKKKTVTITLSSSSDKDAAELPRSIRRISANTRPSGPPPPPPPMPMQPLISTPASISIPAKNKTSLENKQKGSLSAPRPANPITTESILETLSSLKRTSSRRNRAPASEVPQPEITAAQIDLRKQTLRPVQSRFRIARSNSEASNSSDSRSVRSAGQSSCVEGDLRSSASQESSCSNRDLPSTSYGYRRSMNSSEHAVHSPGTAASARLRGQAPPPELPSREAFPRRPQAEYGTRRHEEEGSIKEEVPSRLGRKYSTVSRGTSREYSSVGLDREDSEVEEAQKFPMNLKSAKKEKYLYRNF
ncbi:hypothetical protein NECID01_1878 [Nematocida sp. AWRm77]|nr:hypothetical protein NECID01_1878 [Nematocida sp. AWRm77]